MVLTQRIKLEDYIDNREEVLKLADKDPSLNRKDTAIWEQEMKTAKAVQRAVPGTIFITERGPTENTAGFVETNNPIPHLVQSVMDDVDLAVHVAVHEAMHCDHIHRGIRNLDLGTRFTPKAIKNLEKATKISDLSNINLIEGFTELATAKKVGENSHVLYNQKEVPAAEALDRFVQARTGTSLLRTFQTGNEEDFFKHLTQALKAPTQNHPGSSESPQRQTPLA